MRTWVGQLRLGCRQPRLWWNNASRLMVDARVEGMRQRGQRPGRRGHPASAAGVRHVRHVRHAARQTTPRPNIVPQPVRLHRSMSGRGRLALLFGMTQMTQMTQCEGGWGRVGSLCDRSGYWSSRRVWASPRTVGTVSIVSTVVSCEVLSSGRPALISCIGRGYVAAAGWFPSNEGQTAAPDEAGACPPFEANQLDDGDGRARRAAFRGGATSGDVRYTRHPIASSTNIRIDVASAASVKSKRSLWRGGCFGRSRGSTPMRKKQPGTFSR